MVGYKRVLSGYNHVLGMCRMFESACGCVYWCFVGVFFGCVWLGISVF